MQILFNFNVDIVPVKVVGKVPTFSQLFLSHETSIDALDPLEEAHIEGLPFHPATSISPKRTLNMNVEDYVNGNRTERLEFNGELVAQ